MLFLLSVQVSSPSGVYMVFTFLFSYVKCRLYGVIISELIVLRSYVHQNVVILIKGNTNLNMKREGNVIIFTIWNKGYNSHGIR